MRWPLTAAACLCLSLGTNAAWAHAIIITSSPASNATVSGAELPVLLRYNSRVDHERSVVALLDAEGKRTELPVSDRSGIDTLVTEIGGLKPGAYRLRWQVLSVDGHITRGDIPFTDVAAGEGSTASAAAPQVK